MHQVTILYKGRVQGVGFRASVHNLASGFDVVGFVRNMTDGSVELVAEGDETTLHSFNLAILERMSRYVVSHHVDWSEIEQPSCDDFTIAPTAHG